MSLQEISSQGTNSGHREGREPEKVTILIKGQGVRDQVFTLNRDDKFRRLFAKYCQVKDLNRETVRFLYKGKRIQKHQTPNMLKMKNEAEINALMEQTGGGGRGKA